MLARVGLTQRMTYDIKDVEKINEQSIDFQKVNFVLNEQREITKEYLSKNINI